MAPIAILPEFEPEVAHTQTKFHDWRDDLHEYGYAVIKNAISKEKGLEYQERARAWFMNFEKCRKGLDFSDPATWKRENLPVHSTINTFTRYGLPHEKFMWDLRLEPGMIAPFATLWGTEKLLVSFDALNVTFPNRTDKPRKPAWEHVDQSPLRRGMHCVQGFANLSPAGPDDGGLVIYPGSHKLSEEFFETQTDKSKWETKDIYHFKPEELQWFKDRGLKPHKVCADVGDLVIWDSRCIHYGSEPTEKSSQIRTVVYLAYTPARLARPDQLEIKKEAFSKWSGTTHWPHDNLNVREVKGVWADGEVDPESREEPFEKPEMTDRLLQLAGVKPY